MRDAVVRLATGGLLGGLLLGCAPLSEQEKNARAIQLLEAKEEFLVRQDRCMKMGGAMQMRTRPLEKAGYLDYKAATCVRR